MADTTELFFFKAVELLLFYMLQKKKKKRGFIQLGKEISEDQYDRGLLNPKEQREVPGRFSFTVSSNARTNQPEVMAGSKQTAEDGVS